MMKNIINRIKTLNFLKSVFLISVIVSTCGFIMLLVTSILGSAGILDNNPGSMAIVVIDAIIAAARVLVVVGVACAFIVSIKINKGCRNAFIVAVVAACIRVVIFILRLTLSLKYVNQILALVSDIFFVASLYMLIDSIFEHKIRKSTLFTIVCVGLGTFLLGSIFTCLASITKFSGNLNLAFIFVGDILDVVSVTLIYISFKRFFKLLKHPKQELEALKLEVITNEIK